MPLLHLGDPFPEPSLTVPGGEPDEVKASGAAPVVAPVSR